MSFIQAPSPNFDARVRPPDMIVLHYTGMPTGEAALAKMCDPAAKVSAHYMVEEDGRIFSLVPDERRAWHAGPSKYEGREKVNDFSIGIELVNAQTGRDPFTDAQYQSLILLTTDLVARHGIPLERIMGHREITNFPKIKRDPADNFDWKRYLDGVKATVETHQVRRLVQDAKTGKIAKEAGL